MKNKIRLLVAEDHAVVRMGLVSLLQDEPDIDIVGEARDGAEAIARAKALSPDVILMDLQMPKADGAQATVDILAERPETKILILTTFGTADGIAWALKAGARGAILKSADYADLIAAIRALARGETSVSPEIQRMFRESPPVPELSPRQKQTLEAIARGLTNEDIARELGISANAVKLHITALMAKIGAANRSEAIGIASRRHLIDGL